MAVSVSLFLATLGGCANEPVVGGIRGLAKGERWKLELSRGEVGYVSVPSDGRETTVLLRCLERIFDSIRNGTCLLLYTIPLSEGKINIHSSSDIG